MLDRRALNRAALDRNLLLRRSETPVLAAVERLAALLYERRVVRSSILRGTQHMATADDFLWMRPLVQPALLRGRQAAFGRVTKEWDLDELTAAARDLLDGQTLTRPQLA